MCPFGYWFGLICVDYTGAQMALRKLFLVYVLSTAAAIAAPFVMTWVEGVRRHAIPVNSEMALEPTPAINTPYSDSLGRNTRPACIAPDGIEYFGDVSFAMRGKQGALRLLGNVLANDFYSCAAARDGTVYVLGKDNQGHWLRAYGTSGDPKWTAYTGEFRSRLAIGQDGTPYLVTRGRDDTPSLTAYGEDGSERWSVAVAGWGREPIPPAVGADGTIYVYSIGFQSSPHDLIAISPHGKELWRAAVPGTSGGGLLVSEDGKIFVQVGHGVLAFNSQGKKLWEFTAENQDIDGGIALAKDGTLYLACRFLYALDPAGQAKWSFKSELTYTKRDYFDGSPIVAEDGTIYALSFYQQLYAITPEGRKKWVLHGELAGKGTRWDQLTLTNDGRLLTKAGWLSVSSGLASGGWPTRDHDNSDSRRQGMR
jgi:outer membrane protein assembly factor BamB